MSLLIFHIICVLILWCFLFLKKSSGYPDPDEIGRAVFWMSTTFPIFSQIYIVLGIVGLFSGELILDFSKINKLLPKVKQ